MILVAITLFILPVVSAIFWTVVFLAASIALYWLAWFLAKIGVQVDISGMHLPCCLFLIVCFVSFFISSHFESYFIGIINGFCGAFFLARTLDIWVISG